MKVQPMLDYLGVLNLASYTWVDVDKMVEMMENDGWEILGVEVASDGVWFFVEERILEWIRKC